MKYAAPLSKSNTKNKQNYGTDTAVAPQGITREPSTYGVDFVDNQHQPGQKASENGAIISSDMWSSLANSIQRKSDSSGSVDNSINIKMGNSTGLPGNLKAGIENLSGISMNDVKVHYNSSKPAHLQALAYTQGTDIHIAPQQEKHLPHEAWHVVQQKQGRVKPTIQTKGIKINDDNRLEKEADRMGRKALDIPSPKNYSSSKSQHPIDTSHTTQLIRSPAQTNIIQMRTWGEWLTDVATFTASSIAGWFVDIPTRLKNIFLDIPVKLFHDLEPLVGYIVQAVTGNNIGMNLLKAAGTLFGSLAKAALRLVFGVLEILPVSEIFEIINVAVNQHLRPMNAGELAAANWTYGNRSALWNRVRVSRDDQFLLKVFSYVAGGGDWDAFIGMATYHMVRLQDQGNANANLQNTVHELGHMVQFDREGATYTMGEAAAHGAIGGYGYTYANLQVNPLKTFNREQQCRIGEHGWAVHHGGHPNDYLGSLPLGAQADNLPNVQAAYLLRLQEWRNNKL